MIGGILMIVAGVLILGLSVFIIPNLNPSMFNNTHGSIPVQNLPGFVGNVLRGVGLFGLVSGLIVLGSSVMVRIHPEQSLLFGLLMLIFSVLSFFGSGGFILGAILGIIGGIMTLMWKRPASVTQVPTS
jgi:hypothetical protein